jgi:hypothetical protein
MNEKLFNEIAMKDLQKLNALVSKGYFETSDFNEAALSLCNSLSAYHQEVSNDNREKREYLQERKLA